MLIDGAWVTARVGDVAASILHEHRVATPVAHGARAVATHLAGARARRPVRPRVVERVVDELLHQLFLASRRPRARVRLLSTTSQVLADIACAALCLFLRFAATFFGGRDALSLAPCGAVAVARCPRRPIRVVDVITCDLLANAFRQLALLVAWVRDGF